MQNGGCNFSTPVWHETCQHSPISSQPPSGKSHRPMRGGHVSSWSCGEAIKPLGISRRHKDGQPRFCEDYRRTFNKLLIRKPWPMATLERNLDSLGTARFISVADVASAYWQIPVHPDDVERTALFVTNRGKYCFNRMPFGVCNVPWLFTEMAQKTLGHISELLIYMDDLCVLSATWESHIKSLESLFAALQEAGLTL